MTTAWFPVPAVAATTGLVVMLGGLAAAAPAQADDWVITTHRQQRYVDCEAPLPDRSVRRMGPADVRLRDNSDITWRRFKAKVGRPSSRRWISPNAVKAAWTGRKAAKFIFVNYGGGPVAQYRLQSGVLTGKGWVTSRGIRIGSSLSTVRARYGQQASRTGFSSYPGVWWRLAGRCSPIGDTHDEPTLVVRIRHSRVIKLGVWIGAAGD